MVPIDESAGRGLAVGTVLHWGGNMGWAERDFCVLAATESEFGGWYDCFDLDEPEKNAILHRVEFHSVKRSDDPSVWHSQHFFLTDRNCTLEQCAGFLAEHKRQAAALEATKTAAKDEADRIREIGRRVWAQVWPKGARWAIVAERIVDDSDLQTDYFADHAAETIILAPSFKGRDDFAEMRKAALAIPETRHLGPGCDEWRVLVKDDPKGEGCRTWRGCLGQYEDGGGVYWTEKEAQAALDAALAADAQDNAREPFVPYSPRLPWGGEITSESVEHREKYSGGKGFYLEARRANPWRIRKQSVTVSRYDNKTNTRTDTDEPSDGTLYMLGQRHEHLTASKPDPVAVVAPEVAAAFGLVGNPAAAVKQAGATLTENTEKGGLELRFPAKPDVGTLEALKARGWRWSRFAGCWWVKASDEARAFAKALTE